MRAIHILSTDCTLIGEVVGYTSLRIKRLFRGVGDFELQIPLRHPMAERFARDRILCPVGRPERAMIVEDVSGVEGTDVLSVKGYTLSGIYKRRICVPPAQSESSFGYDRVIADAETVMRHYIENNVTAPQSAARRIACIALEENQNRGMENVPWSVRFESLDEVLSQIGVYADCGFDVVPDFSQGRLTARYLPGRDMTGESGAQRVTFSAAMGSVLTATYSESGRAYKNAAVVAGAGEDENRLILLHGDVQDLERREIYIDAGSEDEAQQLIYKAERTLAEKKLEQAIKAEIKDTRSCQYGVHWDLGDVVNVAAQGRMMKARITQVQEAHEAGRAAKISVVFGDPPSGIERTIRERSRTVAR